MVIHIQAGKTEAADENANIQSLPFQILADCDAEVSKFFTPYVKSKDSKHSASFRGYPLQGECVHVPEGYTGVVLHERIKPETEDDDRKFFIVKNFKSFMYWNWDKEPTKNDPLLKALNDWIDIAEALHSPITEVP